MWTAKNICTVTSISGVLVKGMLFFPFVLCIFFSPVPVSQDMAFIQD